MHPTMKNHLQDRPFATAASRIADNLTTTPMLPEQAQASTLAMIAWAILDHSDAVRELTAALDHKGDQR